MIVDEGEERFLAALETIERPVVHPDLAFVLCTMVGHLFGYEAALAIDASARPLREARGRIETLVSSDAEGDDLLGRLAVAVANRAPTASSTACARRSYDGALDAATAVRLASLLRYATGVVPLDAYQVEFGKVGTPSTLIEDLNAALTKAIEELTRPVDAIKHQAKTVTVGISRSDETLLQVPLVQEVLTTGAPRDSLTYRALRTLVALDPAVDAVVGWTRYRIDGDPSRGARRSTWSTAAGSRATSRRAPPTIRRLRGTKHRAATRTRGHGGARPRRRPHAGARPRGQGQPDHRPDAVARPLPRSACRPRWRAGSSRVTATGTRRSPTKSPRSSR